MRETYEAFDWLNRLSSVCNTVAAFVEVYDPKETKNEFHGRILTQTIFSIIKPNTVIVLIRYTGPKAVFTVKKCMNGQLLHALSICQKLKTVIITIEYIRIDKNVRVVNYGIRLSIYQTSKYRSCIHLYLF